MKELLDKISSYNLFNYLFPGVLFCIIISKWTELELVQDDLINGVFLYYFVGLVISRCGSLIIEPVLKKIKFVVFAEYQDFVKASKDDSKLEILSESNNMYRTLIALFVIILITKSYLTISVRFDWDMQVHWIVLLIGLLSMFLFSYRKQTSYISKRIKANQD